MADFKAQRSSFRLEERKFYRFAQVSFIVRCTGTGSADKTRATNNGSQFMHALFYLFLFPLAQRLRHVFFLSLNAAAVL
jgi:hypothetical protein